MATPVATAGLLDTSSADETALAGGVYRTALAVLMQDANGDDVFSNKKALYGYVQAHEYLVLPYEFHNAAGMKMMVGAEEKDLPKVTVEQFGSLKGIKDKLGSAGNSYRNSTAYLYYNDETLFMKIALLNFKTLLAGNVSEKAAFAVAALRARWCMLGCYNVAKQDQQKAFDEVTIYGDPSNIGNDVASDSYATVYDEIAMQTDLESVLGADIDCSRLFMRHISESGCDVKWVTKIAETLWASEEYITRVRGHHYKDEYAPNLIKFCTACFEGTEVLPKDVEMAVLFRTSIHAFGFRALPIMTGHFAIHGKLGNAALIRFSGAPNGMAVVTTTAAAIRAMASEPWYGQFEQAYKPQMTKLEAFEKAILSDKFGFHQSATLYGVTQVTSKEVGGKEYTIEEMRSVGATMAAIGQGFVDAMVDAVKAGAISTFSFSKAMAMSKHAGSAPLTTLRIKTLIMHSIDAVAQAGSVNAAIAAAIPLTLKASKDNSAAEEVE